MPPANPDGLSNYTFRKKQSFHVCSEASQPNGMEALSKLSPHGTISERALMQDFSEGGKKIRHRLEVEHCFRRDGEEIRNFLHRIKKTVDKGWPDDMTGIACAQQKAGCPNSPRKTTIRGLETKRT